MAWEVISFFLMGVFIILYNYFIGEYYFEKLISTFVDFSYKLYLYRQLHLCNIFDSHKHVRLKKKVRLANIKVLATVHILTNIANAYCLC